jgi:hypothetical protein
VSYGVFYNYWIGCWASTGAADETYAVREHRPLYHMRNGSDRESNPRPQRRHQSLYHGATLTALWCILAWVFPIRPVFYGLSYFLNMLSHIATQSPVVAFLIWCIPFRKLCWKCLLEYYPKNTANGCYINLYFIKHPHPIFNTHHMFALH